MICSFDKGKYCVVIISSVNVSFSTCSNPNVLWTYRLSYFTLGSILYTCHSCGTTLCIPHLCYAGHLDSCLIFWHVVVHRYTVYHITCICIFIPCLLWTFQCWWWLYKCLLLYFLAATWRTCESEARTILSCSGKNVACSRVFLKKNKSSPHHATTMLTLILFGRYQISLISMMSEHLAHPFVAQNMSYEIICIHDCQILIWHG